MKTTKYYHKNSNVVAFDRFENSYGYWSERTYDDKGNELTYKNSEGYFKIKGKEVTKQAFENRVEYNMTNNEIITALENLILLAGSTDNIYMQNKLSNIKNALVEQRNFKHRGNN